MFLIRALFRRVVFVPMMVAAAVSVPYFMNASDPLRPVKRIFASGPTAPGGPLPTTAVDATGFTPRGETPVADLGQAQPELAPMTPADQAFDLDVTIDTIIRRWPRVSTGMAELELYGYRVPLVTGIQEHDVAGSLTYYFDNLNVCQRLSFEGTTGDADQLIQLLSQQFGMTRQAADGPAVYVYKSQWNGEATSELRIRPAAVVRSDQPHRRFDVTFYLSRFQPTWLQRKMTSSR